MIADRSGNLGDMIQTVALSRLVGASTTFCRDRTWLNVPDDRLWIAAGFLPDLHFKGESCHDYGRVVYAGVWFPTNCSEAVRKARSFPRPIGARDPKTRSDLSKHGIPAEMVGCVTLTLPEYDGPRSGAVSVDTEGPGLRVTHGIPYEMPFEEAWGEALRALDRYRTAEVVHTRRLHAALPALAMGTPICYVGDMEGRTSILKDLGVERGKVCKANPGRLRERYLGFLSRHLGHPIVPSEPVMPDVPVGLSSMSFNR
jgi:hypothetical protein